MEMFRLPNIWKDHGELEAKAKLIKKYKLYPEDRLATCLIFILSNASFNNEEVNSTLNGKKIFSIISPHFKSKEDFIKNIKSYFNPDKYGFSHVTKIQMFIAYAFYEKRLDDQTIKEMPNVEFNMIFFDTYRESPSFKTSSGDTTINMKFFDIVTKKEPCPPELDPDNHTRSLFGSINEKNITEKELVIKRRDALKKFNYELAKRFVPKIQAQLALLEIFTLISLDDFIPELLKICPRYLHCPIVAEKILNWSYGVKNENLQCKKYLHNTFSSLKNKKGNPYIQDFRKNWMAVNYCVHLSMALYDLKKTINKKKQKSYEKIIENKFDLNDVSKLVIHGHNAIPDAVLNIMIDKQLIQSEHALTRAFKVVQKSLDLEKHPFGGKDLEILADMDDFLKKNPFALENPDYWKLLEQPDFSQFLI